MSPHDVTPVGSRDPRTAGTPIALVLAGGGARGAYEVGALSVLLPELERRGERPTLLVGTSVGAINAALFAAAAHLPAEEAATAAIKRWRSVRKDRVIRKVMTRQVPLTMLRYAGQIVSVPGMRVPALLDPTPLAGNLEHWVDWTALHDNIADGRVLSVAAVASSAASGRSVVFVESAPGASMPAHASHNVDYVEARLTIAHVEASAAIPILFPPVRVDTPPSAAGWYFDGGTRLNTPIKPALELGARRVLIISSDALDPAPWPDDSGVAPDFGTGALHLLERALVDPLITDLRRLAHVNTYLADVQDEALRHYRMARGKPPYRPVPYLLVAPERRYELGAVAAEVLRTKYGGLKGLRDPDLQLLSRLLGRESPAHAELFSYLFFDPDFLSELIAMGRADARRWLASAAGPHAPWRIEPLEALGHRREVGAAGMRPQAASAA